MSLKNSAIETIEFLDEWLSEHFNIDTDVETFSLTFIHHSKQFLINFHASTEEIWYASPLSGGHHFHYRDQKWLCTRTKKTLENVLKNDLT
jgi:iron donor protein CyaY